MFEMRCLRKLSIQYYQKNEFEKMSSLNQESLRLARKLKNKTDEMRCLYNIGIAFQKNEEYARSLSYYEDALQLSLEPTKKEMNQAPSTTWLKSTICSETMTSLSST